MLLLLVVGCVVVGDNAGGFEVVDIADVNGRVGCIGGCCGVDCVGVVDGVGVGAVYVLVDTCSIHEQARVE